MIFIRPYDPIRDVSTGKLMVRPQRWWAEYAPHGWNRVKISENLGAIADVLVSPMDTYGIPAYYEF